MAAANMTPLSSKPETPYRQSEMPNHLKNSLSTKDTNAHDYRAAAKGKGRASVAVSNPWNQTLTATVYGTHAVDGEVADLQTFEIGSFTITAAENQKYETFNDPFPWYIVRLKYASTPVGTGSTELWVNFSAF